MRHARRMPENAPGRMAAWACAGALVAAMGGCVGSLHDPEGASAAGPEVTTDAGNGTLPADDGGSVAVTDGGMGDGGAGDAGACAVTLAAPAMRRLTNAEYVRTVRDLTGETANIESGFPPDPLTGGFDNNISTQHVVTLNVAQYQDAAEVIATEVMADPSRRAMVVGCDPAAGDACLTAFIRRFGQRVYRRPLTDDEAARLLALAHTAAGDTDPATTGASLVIRALLQSPSFLFRVEVGMADPSRPGLLKLTGYEMATRLAYTLWGTAPDDALLSAAGAGALDTADGVASEARRMLTDPRAHDAARSFTDQWLQLNLFPGVNISQTVFTSWSERLRASMAEETRRYVDDFIWRDGARVIDLLTARYTFLDPTLAAYYGIALPPGTPGTPGADGGVADTWARVDLPPDSPRGGLLTQGSVLTLTSNPDESSPVHRGKFVREQLLCEDIGSPPPNVPPLPPRTPGLSQRQRLDQHRVDPACSGCHNRMDPIGFGLERFDGVGRYSLTDDQGRPLTGAGSIQGFDAPDFVGEAQLAQRLHDAPEFPACVVTQMFRFANGRLESPGDACGLGQIGAAFQSAHYDYREMLVALVRNDAYRYLQPDTSTVTGSGP